MSSRILKEKHDYTLLPPQITSLGCRQCERINERLKETRLRDEVARAVAEEHEHGEEPLGLFRVVVQALHEQLQAALRTQLADERPQLGQQLVQVRQTWRSAPHN